MAARLLRYHWMTVKEAQDFREAINKGHDYAALRGRKYWDEYCKLNTDGIAGIVYANGRTSHDVKWFDRQYDHLTIEQEKFYLRIRTLCDCPIEAAPVRPGMNRNVMAMIQMRNLAVVAREAMVTKYLNCMVELLVLADACEEADLHRDSMNELCGTERAIMGYRPPAEKKYKNKESA